MPNSENPDILQLTTHLNQNPEDAQAWSDLGLLYWQQPGQLEHAQSCYEKAISLAPEFPQLKANLGLVLLQLQKLEAAKVMLEQAVDESQRNPMYINNLIALLLEMRDYKACRPLIDESLSAWPDNPIARTSLSFFQLYDRNYSEGLANYEYRLALNPRPLPDNLPLWRGEDLNGKQLLCLAEQGVGDIFQMLRYAQKLKSQYDVTITAEVLPGLETLIRTQTYIDNVVPLRRQLPPSDTYDFAVYALSLPSQLQETWDQLYSPDRYILPPGGYDAKIRQLFDPLLTKPRIGLVWEGNPTHAEQRYRVLPIAEIRTLVTDTRFDWYSLQKGAGESVFTAPDPPQMTALGSCLTNWAATSLVLQQLDLLIACDTGIVHLAGAMGIPTWVAITAKPDWRWSHTLSTSPWYASLSLFRQTEFGDWGPVFIRIKEALNDRFFPH